MEEVDESSDRSEGDMVIVRCRTLPGRGKSCTVDGEEIEGGLVEAVKEGKKVAEEEDKEAFYQNVSLGSFWSLEEFLESCPKLRDRLDWAEKGFLTRLKSILKKYFG